MSILSTFEGLILELDLFPFEFFQLLLFVLLILLILVSVGALMAGPYFRGMRKLRLGITEHLLEYSFCAFIFCELAAGIFEMMSQFRVHDGFHA